MVQASEGNSGQEVVKLTTEVMTAWSCGDRICLCVKKCREKVKPHGIRLVKQVTRRWWI